LLEHGAFRREAARAVHGVVVLCDTLYNAAMQAFVAWLVRHRRRVARAVMLVGVLVVSAQFVPNWPRETDVEFALGQGHANVVELRVSYLSGDDELHGVAFNFPEGAPGVVHHHVTLPAGDFEVRCELRGRAGDSHRIVRHLHAPAAGHVRISLAPESLSRTAPALTPSGIAERVRGGGWMSRARDTAGDGDHA
jgi:hypothetical protein